MKSEGRELTEPSNSICPKCSGHGFVYQLKDGKIDYSHIVPCECQAERIAREKKEWLMQYCELPGHSDDKTLDSYIPGNHPTLKQALNAAKALASGSEKIKWLTLSGTKDLGKSHLAIAVCRQWIEHGHPAKYVFVPSLLDWLRECMNNKDLNLAGRMKVLCEVPLLVMDDLGAQNPTPWAQERLITIINYRYENWLPLMVTTNKSVDKLPGDDEGRIGSRLKRFVPGTVIAMEGPEYRTRRGK
ncbi:MAG: ATP-binding protein [Dehalococcoidales bacterium]|nr:ATP-binding protein [Dehalococcoidales bacterium]